ncbi:MAG: YggT family protein [Coxiellaceae bacterium]|nr:MAG: YggT family protein [Coxiellaceae bacterium]
MFDSIIQIVAFIIQIALDFLIFMLMIRLVVQIHQTNLANPFVKLVYRITDFLAKPTVRIIPPWKGVEYGLIVTMLILAVLQVVLVVWVRFDHFPSLFAVMAWPVAEIGSQFINVYFYALIIYVIFNWIHLDPTQPVFEVILTITRPLLAPFRRFFNLRGAGLTLAILSVAVLLKLVDIILFTPIVRTVSVQAALGVM